MTLPHREQFRGSLIGQCLGDALGFPVEGYSRDECKLYVDRVFRQGNDEYLSRPPYKFGQYTDDSQLARELVQSYVHCGKFDTNDYAERIKLIFMDERIVGKGMATEQAAVLLQKGVPWQDSGTPVPSAGNGSAMRAGPVGLFFFDNPEKLIKTALEQGIITHKDKRCIAGSVVIAGAVALALQQRPTNVQHFLSRLKEWSERIDEQFAGYIEYMGDWVLLSPEKAAEKISRAGLDSDFSDGSYHGISPFVVGSVLWSLYSFLKTPDDYMEVIRTAIAAGGDVDTTAAMAGAICGAYLGLEAIPLDLARCLTDQGTWGFEELVELADRCYDLKIRQIQIK